MSDGQQETDGDSDSDEETDDAQKRIAEASDRILDRWEQSHSEEVREQVVGSYIETGSIDHIAAGVEELEVQMVEAAYTNHVVSLAKAEGLTMAEWLDHIDEAELPAFRRAVVEGNWGLLRSHAQASKKMRIDLSL